MTRLPPTQIRRVLARRIAHLDGQIRHREANGQSAAMFREEQQALVQCLELVQA